MKLCKIENIIFEKEKYIKMIVTIAIKLFKIFNYRIIRICSISLFYILFIIVKIMFLFFFEKRFLL